MKSKHPILSISLFLYVFPFKILYSKFSIRRSFFNDGFSLIELMISVSILSVGILALVTMQVSSIRVNNSASNLTEAIIMAQAQSERLISLPLSHPDLTDTDGDGNSGLDDDTSGTADHSYESDSIFSIFWNVASEEIISNTKTVNVIVTWNDKHLNLQRVIPGK